MSKTSTFTIHHDRCDPSQWRPCDVLALSEFIKTGDMGYAARLARLGVQLVTSEKHVPKGGDLEHIGWAKPDWDGEYSPELDDLVDEDIEPVCAIYRGHVEYAARLAIGDGEGNVEGFEYEIKPTQAEAEAYFDGAHTVQ